MNRNKFLIVGGISSILISLVHIVIMIGGADWYRFFGAGEDMALLSENGSAYPIIITTIITLILAIWGLYAFSGAGLLMKLPFLKPILIIISIVYIIRGVFGIPMALWVDHPHLNELQERTMFVVFSSLISLTIGCFYLIGTIRIKSTLKQR